MRYCWKPWNGCTLSSEPRSASVALLLLLTAGLLSACGAMQPQDADQAARLPLYQQRMARLGPLDSWALEGRLAVRDAEDGGTGFLSWRQQQGDSRMDFHGALGRGAWRLLAADAGAELEFADGRQFRADSIDALVRSQVGWNVPVEMLSWWVRGLAAPGKVRQKVLDEEGRLSELNQHGWSIEYGRYGRVGDETMPLKLTARQADRSVKLAISKWLLQDIDEP
jgi:outer membrane lipoprotein LolB